MTHFPTLHCVYHKIIYFFGQRISNFDLKEDLKASLICRFKNKIRLYINYKVIFVDI